MRRHDQRHLGRRLADTLPNLEAARHERYSVLVGATGSKNPHADILRHGAQADRERRKVGPNTRKIIRNLSPNTAI